MNIEKMTTEELTIKLCGMVVFYEEVTEEMEDIARYLLLCLESM